MNFRLVLGKKFKLKKMLDPSALQLNNLYIRQCSLPNGNKPKLHGKLIASIHGGYTCMQQVFGKIAVF